MKLWTAPLKTLTRAAVCAVLVPVSGCHVHADWPGLQGPDQNGVVTGSRIARHWPPGGPKVLWSAPVGPGYGGPSIRDGEVYLLDREDDERDVLRCLDLATGRELWRFTHEVPGRLTFNGSRSVPTVGRERVFAVGPFGHFYCVDRLTHQPLWQVQILERFAKEPQNFGFVQAPLLYKDTVIVCPASKTVGMVALDRATGHVRWQSEPLGTKGYVSPRLHRFAGVDGVLLVTDQQVSSIDANSGTLLWKYTAYNPPQPIAFPTVLDQGRLFVSAGDDVGSVMLEVTKDDAGFTARAQFAMKDHGAQLHPPLYHQGHLYGKFNTYETFDRSRKLVSRFICLDLDGRIRWRFDDRRIIERGNWIIADGLLFILDGSTGELTMVEANPAQYRELARARVLEGEPSMISPLALSDGRLLVRDQQEIKCLDVSDRR